MNVISMIMLVFAVLGALDRIFGNRFGLGKEFEKGFMLLGNMALSMIGMIVLAPAIARGLSSFFGFVNRATIFDASVIPAVLFANDMGGASLAREIAENEAIGMFNALVVSSMFGCTISFSIPLAMNTVKKESLKDFFLGTMCGIATIPVGCFVSGLMLRIPIGLLLTDLLPLVILSVLIGLGIVLIPRLSTRIFTWLGVGIKVLITLGLVFSMIQFFTGFAVIPGLAPIGEAGTICLNAAITLSGAFPLMFIISKLLGKALGKVEKKLAINEASANGFLSSIVSNVPTLEMMNRMDRKGIILNAGFAVSASFTFAGHLAFTMAFDASYLFPVIVGKLIAGIAGFVSAWAVYYFLFERKGKKQAI